MQDIYIIIIIAGAALNIALFCKVWIMTNDIKLIKEELTSTKTNYYALAKEYHLLGDREKTKEYLDKSLCKSMINTYKEFSDQDRDTLLDSEIRKKYESYSHTYKKANLSMPDIENFLNRNNCI